LKIYINLQRIIVSLFSLTRIYKIQLSEIFRKPKIKNLSIRLINNIQKLRFFKIRSEIKNFCAVIEAYEAYLIKKLDKVRFKVFNRCLMSYMKTPILNVLLLICIDSKVFNSFIEETNSDSYCFYLSIAWSNSDWYWKWCLWSPYFYWFN